MANPNDGVIDKAQENAKEIAEQKRLLMDPLRSFETPTPTPQDQLKEAAAAGLTEASAKEVWQQTRALIMTEDLDAVSRDDLLEKLGPEPTDDKIILIDAGGKEVADIEIVDKSLWMEAKDGSEYRIVIGQSNDGFRWAIDDGAREQGGDLSSISWSASPVDEKEVALGHGMKVAREFFDLPRNAERVVEREEEDLAL